MSSRKYPSDLLQSVSSAAAGLPACEFPCMWELKFDVCSPSTSSICQPDFERRTGVAGVLIFVLGRPGVIVGACAVENWKGSDHRMEENQTVTRISRLNEGGIGCPANINSDWGP